MPLDFGHTTALLHRMNGGDAAAEDELLALLYAELRRVAGGLMEAEGAGHTLQATALVNEAFVRLFGGEAQVAWNDRAHFVRTATRAMRNVLVDHARARRREKRGGGARREALDLALDELERDGQLDLVDLHDVLDALAKVDERAARIVELRFFAGLSIAETAEALAVSTPTVERDWRFARLWVSRELGGGAALEA